MAAERIERLSPKEIEQRSFAILTEEANGRIPDDDRGSIIKRVIHTTADFDYLDNLCFSGDAVKHGLEALKNGGTIITDSNMAYTGINMKSLTAVGAHARCFMSDDDVAREAEQKGVTRASVCMEKAASIEGPLIFAIGNAPTALIRLYELIQERNLKPELIIGVPVGFVNVIQSKEMIMQTDIPYIVAKGRKGGSTVAASICNALLYMLDENRKTW